MNLASAISIFGYGTSEGVRKAWDTRGRGRKAPVAPTKPLQAGETTKTAWTDPKTGEWDKRRETFHQNVVNSFLYGKTPPEGRKPIIYVLGGGTASGKSTASKKILGKNPGFVDVNPDNIKLAIPEYAGLKETDPERAAWRVHEESSYVTKQLLAEAGAKGLDITYDSTTSGSTGPAMATEFADHGYDVRALFVDAPLKDAMARAEWRANHSDDPANFGRHVPEEIIKDSHQGAAANYMQLRHTPGLTSQHFYDTTEKTPRLIHERTSDGKETIHDPERWNRYQQKASGENIWAFFRRPHRRSLPDAKRHRRFAEVVE